MELPNFNIKKFLIFSQKKAVFIFQEMDPPPAPSPAAPQRNIYIHIYYYYIFPKDQKTAFLIFRETEPPRPKKRILIIQETELSYIPGNGKPTKFLIFYEVTF